MESFSMQLVKMSFAQGDLDPPPPLLGLGYTAEAQNFNQFIAVRFNVMELKDNASYSFKYCLLIIIKYYKFLFMHFVFIVILPSCSI